MNSKTLDIALISLSVGCLVIGIFEIMARGIEWAYFWIMLSVGLWLAYSFRKRKRINQEQTNSDQKPASKVSPASKPKPKRKRR